MQKVIQRVAVIHSATNSSPNLIVIEFVFLLPSGHRTTHCNLLLRSNESETLHSVQVQLSFELQSLTQTAQLKCEATEIPNLDAIDNIYLHAEEQHPHKLTALLKRTIFAT